jgi:hypothetical protein
MKKRFLYLFCLVSLCSAGQINEDLTPEERAYLFHVVKKSPILNNNFGRFFDYQGPEILFSNKSINYDSIELLIINQPDLLIVRKEEIAKSPKGLIAEAANKMAVWELNNVLSAKRDNPDDLKHYKNEYAYFESLLMSKLPPNSTKVKNDINQPHPKIQIVMNPNMTLDDKTMQLASLKFLTTNDQIVTLNVINDAINDYVEKRAFEIYRALGGKAESFKNVLVAAGDGSNTEGILEEREKDEKGRWNRGLPKAVGLFPYQLIVEKAEEKKKVTEKIESLRYTTNNFVTSGNNKFTNLHFDVWGYNSEKQTTVVIEKNGLNYHLFGSKDTRFLSPDSTFSEGTTFQAIINDLEFNKIAKIKELIYGKKGYDYWIDYNQKKKDATELKIEKKEKEYSDLGFSPITTSKKASSKVKKSKRQAINSGARDFDGTPTTSYSRKDRKSLQGTIVGLYNLFEAYKRKIAELEKEKAEAIDLMAIYQRKLDVYKQTMGIRWATYTEENGLYTFEDSTTFDIITQEFQFKPSANAEAFEVRLIAIPESCLSRLADEVMLHINVMDAEPNYDARINLDLMDVFESDKWELPGPLFKVKDSIALRIFFEGMLDKKIPFEIIARGQGVGSWNGVQTVKDQTPKEISRYPGNAATSKMDSTFVRLRKSEVLIHIDREITMEINSFTDPVSSSISISNEELNTGMIKYKLSKNDILSAYRTVTILKTLKSELNVLAGNYLNREEAKIVIDRFNKLWLKTKINVGRTSFKLDDF